jgi:hypothetical protein
MLSGWNARRNGPPSLAEANRSPRPAGCTKDRIDISHYYTPGHLAEVGVSDRIG